ncbi:TIGR00725 family protein [Candidatus Saccharibacteria bacterium]|nr:TIGR00725 family protein [Candidatus Saccharibacteria bacterium]
MKKLQIAVIGSAGNEEYPFRKPAQAMFAAAEKIGRLLAENNCIVINGGKGGVMEAVCRGAKSADGLTVAEVAGDGRLTSNDYVDIEVVTTDVGFRGPSSLIGMSDAVISLGGGAGTLQEIAVAYRMKKPIIFLMGYGGWTDRIEEDYLDERNLVKIVRTSSEEDAVKYALKNSKVALAAIRSRLQLTDKDDRITTL